MEDLYNKVLQSYKKDEKVKMAVAAYLSKKNK
jgi:hypothetical protein